MFFSQQFGCLDEIIVPGKIKRVFRLVDALEVGVIEDRMNMSNHLPDRSLPRHLYIRRFGERKIDGAMLCMYDCMIQSKVHRRLRGVVRRRKAHGTKLALASVPVALLAVFAVDPVAAQPAGAGEIESVLQEFIPWALRWMLAIGAIVAVGAHVYAGWTSDPDKAFRRKEWRNRAFFGVALAIPALLILNGIITAFGGEAIDFLPFI